MVEPIGSLGRGRSRRSRVDWLLVGAVTGLLILGSLAILSAIIPVPSHSHMIHKHLLAMVLGAVAFFFATGLHYQIYQEQWKLTYGLSIILLIAVLLFGETLRGSKAWFKIGFISFQPSELARIFLVVTLASFLSRRGSKIKSLGTILGVMGLSLPILFLIIKEPDFSSTFILFPVILAILFCAGANLLHLGFFLGCGFLGAVFTVLWVFFSIRSEWIESSSVVRYFMELSHPNVAFILTCLCIVGFSLLAWWFFVQLRIQIPWFYFVGMATAVIVGLILGNVMESQMKQYQRDRFVAFLDPGVDPRGAGYNSLQAQIAIGSGGFLGKGIFSGTQSQLGFVPERHTDFVLAVVGEEMGFLGNLLLLGLYLLLLGRIFQAARVAPDSFGYLLACGIGSMYACYFFINAGMSVGVVPVAGVPLPLVSYGGSNLVTTLWSLGIVESIYSRRYTFA
ncbi:MAG: FtsW/RodA/SpoVE family cell cycle protein [Elusimicrobia bacterium]|nr:FtsW/RodA/SpoVE family cell cycle protein [Elusimicrobiota bacterium]